MAAAAYHAAAVCWNASSVAHATKLSVAACKRVGFRCAEEGWMQADPGLVLHSFCDMKHGGGDTGRGTVYMATVKGW